MIIDSEYKKQKRKEKDIFKNELDSIHELQLECFENAFAFDKMPPESQKEHIDNLLTLLDKQKLLKHNHQIQLMIELLSM